MIFSIGAWEPMIDYTNKKERKEHQKWFVFELSLVVGNFKGGVKGYI